MNLNQRDPNIHDLATTQNHMPFNTSWPASLRLYKLKLARDHNY